MRVIVCSKGGSISEMSGLVESRDFCRDTCRYYFQGSCKGMSCSEAEFDGIEFHTEIDDY